MSYRQLCKALLSGKPYAGLALRAMQGPAERHRFFKPTVRAAAESVFGPLEILEIGSWAGVSTISWGIALRDLSLEGKITCVDPWVPYFDTDVNAMPVYKEMNEAAESNLIRKLFEHNITAAGLRDIILVKRGTSREVLSKLPDKHYGLIYVDGSHKYDDVSFDLSAASRLLRDGGILCGDDLELHSGEVDPYELEEAIRNGSDYVLSKKVGQYYHPGVTAAVGQVIGPVSAWKGFWAVRLQSDEWKPLAVPLESADLPVHVANHCVQLEQEDQHYRVYSYDGRYFAVSRNVPADILQELMIGVDISSLIFVGTSREEAIEKWTASMEMQTPPAAFQPRIVTEHRGFNVVSLNDVFYGLRQSLGEVDLSMSVDMLINRHGTENILIANTVEGLQSRIDHIEIFRRISDLAQHVDSIRNDMRQADINTTELQRRGLEETIEAGRSSIADAIKQERECTRSIVLSLEQRLIQLHQEVIRDIYDRIARVIEQEGESRHSVLCGLEQQLDQLRQEVGRKTDEAIARYIEQKRETAFSGLQDLQQQVNQLRQETIEAGAAVALECFNLLDSQKSQ